MTENFVSAAELMRQVLNAEAVPFVTIDHPISSATTDELRQRAIAAADKCAELLLGRS